MDTPAVLDRLRSRAAIAGAGAAVVWGGCVLARGLDRGWFSYLTAYVFWIGVALGCLALALLHHLTGGRWGLVIRRPLESAAGTLPAMALLFLPLLGGLPRLYEWARPEAVASSHVLQSKHLYLNVPFFVARAALYFAVWIALTKVLTRWSAAQDERADARSAGRLQGLAGPGLVLFALTTTFAAIDWVMSLDAEWFSTIFGILTIGGQGLSALAFVTVVLVLLAREEPLASVVRPLHYHDLGKLMLAFVMLWAYFNLSQFLIIWAGNLPEEIPWYLRRLRGGYGWTGLALALLHFGLPFLLLLSADVKKHARALAAVALLVLAMRGVDVIWLIAPEYKGAESAHVLDVVMDVAALVALGGLWVRLFASRLKKRPLLPVHDPEWVAAEAAP